ncbi:hypothetical protein GHT06_016689 [Daphnia sinensis]|uniref:BPTI/Kunitz inhibitor domain-containing protein n=1 Tax=Daphnia sinensis TaxID=1820382 RepID=A0AAD5L7T8_9CRUS|nr:hypothetical protein GHT06_016689 [Daphnia sinensis]
MGRTSTVGSLMLIASLIVSGTISGSLAQGRFGARGNFAGGYSSVDVEDDLVKEMANFATTALSENSNSEPLALIKIVKAESQVVAGKNFKLILELDNVRHVSEYENLVCEVVVFDQPWTSTRQLRKSNCLPTRVIHSWTKTRELAESNSPNEMTPVVEEVVVETRAPTVGGYSPIDVKHPDVKEMADFATTSISESSNSGPLVLLNIVEAEVQVVAGQNFKLTLELGSAIDGATGANLVCKVVVFDQSWTNRRHLRESNCLPSTDLVTEIMRAIDGHQELWRVANYLNESREELSKEFPLVSPDGTKLSYTFFAPTSFAFMMQTPQDVGDPLLMDSDFRRSILTRHLSATLISPDDLAKADLVLMASRSATLTRRSTNEDCNLPPVNTEYGECEAYMPSWTFKSNSGTCESFVYGGCGQTANLFGTEEACQAACDPAVHPLTNLINEAEIQPVAIPLAHDFGTVYVINRVFMDGDEVSEVLRKHPSPGFGFFGLPMAGNPLIPNENILGRITGGYSSNNVEDPEIKEMADFAVAGISANVGPVRLVRILKADTNTVAGKNFKLMLELKRGVDGDDGEGLLCDAVVFDQPWTNTRKLSESSCLSIKTIASWNEIHKQPISEPESKCLKMRDPDNEVTHEDPV